MSNEADIVSRKWIKEGNWTYYNPLYSYNFWTGLLGLGLTWPQPCFFLVQLEITGLVSWKLFVSSHLCKQFFITAISLLTITEHGLYKHQSLKTGLSDQSSWLCFCYLQLRHWLTLDVHSFDTFGLGCGTTGLVNISLILAKTLVWMKLDPDNVFKYIVWVKFAAKLITLHSSSILLIWYGAVDDVSKLQT